ASVDLMSQEAPHPIPWQDRGKAVEPPVNAPTPRSARDMDILRSLAKRINPHDAGAHNNLGVVFYNKGLYEEAIEHFEKALELDQRMQVADRNLQIAYFHTGYYERLVADLRAKLLADPSDLRSRERLARAYLYGGDVTGAIREWKR